MFWTGELLDTLRLKAWVIFSILPSQRVCDLGIILDSDLTLTAHISHIVSVCYFHLRQLR